MRGGMELVKVLVSRAGSLQVFRGGKIALVSAGAMALSNHFRSQVHFLAVREM